MSDPTVLIAIISTIGGVLLAALTLVGNIITKRLDAAAEQRAIVAKAQEDKAKEADDKLNHLTVLSNSNLTATNVRLDDAMNKITALTELMAKQAQVAKDELVEEMRKPTTVPIAQAAGEIAEAAAAMPPVSAA